MDKLRCIIIDDEEGAHLVISHYLKEISYLELIGQFYNASDAMDFIYSNRVDLMLLDINMPGISGLQMLEALSVKPMVVLTTAYKEYALDGYKYEVVDYLVKPFTFDKFLAAIDKVKNRKIVLHQNSSSNDSIVDFLMLKVDGNLIRIELADINHIQSFGNYIKVFTKARMYMTQLTTTEIEKKLSPTKFMRVHKSYIIALNRISKVNGGQIALQDGTIIPLGNTYKRELIQRLNEM